MLVTVEIDLTLDPILMEHANQDPRILAAFMVADGLEDAESLSKVCEIGRKLWNHSRFIEPLAEHCGDDLYRFEQRQALLFIVKTTMEAACLFRMACHAPEAVMIREPRKIKPVLRFPV